MNFALFHKIYINVKALHFFAFITTYEICTSCKVIKIYYVKIFFTENILIYNGSTLYFRKNQ